MDETCRLRRGEGYGACEDEPPEARLRCHRIKRHCGAIAESVTPSGDENPRALSGAGFVRLSLIEGVLHSIHADAANFLKPQQL